MSNFINIVEVELPATNEVPSDVSLGIIGTALRGETLKPKLITSLQQFIQEFGPPIAQSFATLAADNYLRAGNKLYYIRIGSNIGSDKIRLATTDEPAKLTFTSISFPVFGSLTFMVDSNTYAVNGINANNMGELLAALNSGLSGAAIATSSSANTVTISTISTGPFASLQLVNSTIQGFATGNTVYGKRTVKCATQLTPAKAISDFISGNSINTQVTPAIATTNNTTTHPVNTLYNVSKLARKADGIIALNAQVNPGIYGQLIITASNNSTQFSNTNTISITFNISGNNTVNYTGNGTDTSLDAFNTLASSINSHSTISKYVIASVDTSNPNNPKLIIRRKEPFVFVTAITISTSTNLPSGLTFTYTDNNTPPLNTTSDLTNYSFYAGTLGTSLKISDPSGSTIYLLAGVDYNIGSSITDTANNIAAVISNLSASPVTALSSANTIKLESKNAGVAGNNIEVSFNSPFIVVSLSNVTTTGGITTGKLKNGFDARNNYQFAVINITNAPINDTTTLNFDFDGIDSNLLVGNDPHLVPLDVIVQAINNKWKSVTSRDDNIAFKYIDINNNEHIRIVSPFPGSEGVITITDSQNIGSNNDPIVDSTITSGTGDNHFTFIVNNTYTVDVYLPSSASLSLQSAVNEINAVARKVNIRLSNIASVEQDGNGYRIVLTSPTPGGPDFGSRIQIINPLSTIIPIQDVFGTGDLRFAISIFANTPGSWANGLRVRLVNEDPRFHPQNSFRIDIIYNNQIVEQYRDVVLDPNSSNFIENVLQRSQYIRADFDADLFDFDPNTIGDVVSIVDAEYVLSNGADGITNISSSDAIQALELFKDTKTININMLALPDFSTLPEVFSMMSEVVRTRGDSFAVIDPPPGLLPQEVIEWINGSGHGNNTAINDNYLSVYYPWVKLNNRFVPPSVAVVRTIATSRTDPWFAIAGFNRGSIQAQDVETILDDTTAIILSDNAINPIMKIVGSGIFIMGDRTTDRSTRPLSRLHIRRLLNAIKPAALQIFQQFLFEPANTETKNTAIALLRAMLDNVFARRGLAEPAGIVDVSNPTNPRVFKINVKIVPLEAIESITLEFVVTPQGVSVNE